MRAQECTFSLRMSCTLMPCIYALVPRATRVRGSAHMLLQLVDTVEEGRLGDLQ
jgi:hypothetical protein